MEHSRKKIDITGQRFGRLTVLGPAENIGGRTAWRCRCECGNECVVKTVRLRDGRTASCGCEHKQKGLDALTYVDGTCVEMLAAKTVRSNNTSGVPGVYWVKRKSKWSAAICFKGKRYSLGNYSKFEDAVSARKIAEANLHDAFLQEYSKAVNGGAS